MPCTRSASAAITGAAYRCTCPGSPTVEEMPEPGAEANHAVPPGMMRVGSRVARSERSAITHCAGEGSTGSRPASRRKGAGATRLPVVPRLTEQDPTPEADQLRDVSRPIHLRDLDETGPRSSSKAISRWK